MNTLDQKIQQLIEGLEELKKAQSQDKKKAKKLPPVPPPPFNPEDHPPKLSESDVKRLIKEELLEEGEEEVLKTLPNGQWVLEKTGRKSMSGKSNIDWTKTGHSSVFNMDHVNRVAGMKSHDSAKQYAHSIVDESTAKDDTKKKIKSIIDSSKNPRHLAQSMSNLILAHQGLRVI